MLLVDTYDTLRAVRSVADLARELGERFRVSAIRLDSGDLASLATAARTALDEAGLRRVKIFASGGLDEHSIAALVSQGAPIDGFGVGTRMGVAEDAPALDMVYKLVDYAGRGRTKLSPAKQILPGPKQVFRTFRNGEAAGDLITAASEPGEGRPLLLPVMRGGRRLPGSRETLENARERARTEIAELPARCRGLEPADPPYRVEVSSSLRGEQARLAALLRTR